MGVKNWLQHAFAVEKKLPPPTSEELALVNKLAVEIVRRELSTPAIALLEMSKPLNYISSQAMRFFEPAISSIVDANDYVTLAKFLERRDSLEILIRMVEEQDQKRTKGNASP